MFLGNNWGYMFFIIEWGEGISVFRFGGGIFFSVRWVLRHGKIIPNHQLPQTKPLTILLMIDDLHFAIVPVSGREKTKNRIVLINRKLTNREVNAITTVHHQIANKLSDKQADLSSFLVPKKVCNLVKKA